ncbi:non-ribosomal peptide synthetase [Ornithinibacillus scapharcae]|uniref:non-ribosomal peptide synthetase n=1 Tax=Ornithinibacillus scapharcae TaxID=1147159 RepID=UPI000225AE88|nr:non-ribosomal peptide synthetase [Ornithinibacillus scapharcae]
MKETMRKNVGIDNMNYLMFPITATREDQIQRLEEEFIHHIKATPMNQWIDLAYTYQIQGIQGEYRSVCVVENEDTLEKEMKLEDNEWIRGKESPREPIAFMFPGQGSQYVNMAVTLYHTTPIYRKHFDYCANFINELKQYDIRDIIYRNDSDTINLLKQTQYTQPILFSLEYALCKYWMELGVKPDAMIGHSIGEYVAACISGSISVEDALQIVIARGELMQSIEKGSMLAVNLDQESLHRRLPDYLDLAAINSPSQCVVAGYKEDIERFQNELNQQGIHSQLLETSHAFHSFMIEPILEKFRDVLQTVEFSRPIIPWISNVTGTWIQDNQVQEPEYWVRHLRGTVNFSQGIQMLLNHGYRNLLEVGPGDTLSRFAKNSFKEQINIFQSLPHPKSEQNDKKFYLQTAGKLWTIGFGINWYRILPTENATKLALDEIDIKRDIETDRIRVIPKDELSQEFVGVRDTIINIWKKVLQTEKITPTSNFFDLGGHSMLGLRIVSQIKEVLNVKIPLTIIFNNPTVSGMTELVLQERQANNDNKEFEIAHKDEEIIITPNQKDRYESFPLTDLAQAYYLGRETDFDLGNIGSHIYYELESEELDIERFERSFQQLIDRHDMLRVVILSNVEQKVLRDVKYNIIFEDLREMPVQKKDKRFMEIRDEVAHRVPDPKQWPLFEIRVTHFSDSQYFIHIRFDYMIIDALSLDIINREWLKLYNDSETELGETELLYRDYMIAIQGLKETETYKESLSYWNKRLDTFAPAPTLPVTNRKLEHTRLVGRQGNLPAHKWESLKRIASKAGITPSSILCAIFADVLSRWSENKKFTLNLPTFNRLPLHSQVNELVGSFTSTTLLEVDQTNKKTFIDRAKAIQEQMLQDLDHREVSGIHILRELSRKNGDPSKASMPVVFTSLVNQDRTNKKWEVLNWIGKEVFRSNQAPQILIDHQVWEENDGSLAYNWDTLDERFPPGLIEEMYQTYCQLIEQLSTEEVLWESVNAIEQVNGFIDNQQLKPVERDYKPKLLHELFIESVQLYPNQTAVISEEKSLTYSELYQYSRSIERVLIEAGTRKENVVAVIMDKGWEQSVAVLSILMSGGIYLPIEPTIPQNRLEYILEQSNVDIILTQEKYYSTLSQSANHIIVINEERLPTTVEYPLELLPKQLPEDIAYIIYTSGSTGRPKGVVITHKSAMNTLLDVNEKFDVTKEDRVLALSSLSFDLSVYDIFGTLATGATIIIPNSEQERDPEYLRNLMLRERVTVWNSVPALMELVLQVFEQHTSREIEHTLKNVFLSGDWIPLDLPDRIRNYFPDVRIVSMGGATEASIWSIYYEINQVLPNWKSIPYGRPLSNQYFRILDENMEPCPVWVPGKLYIGGVGLAQGYWCDEKKTNASFVYHPTTGERLYDTGDIGRFVPDGNIEFLGRVDNQVKIRGYRIELGEIESLLKETDMVKDTVVIAHQEAESTKQIVAYVVPDHQQLEADYSVYEKNQVTQWNTVYDKIYSDQQPQVQQHNYAGWIDSFTGKEIPEIEMEAWVNHTVERIRSLKPKKVLEIGCGTGLILQKLASETEKYVGTDISEEALKYLSQHVSHQHIHLEILRADQVEMLEEASFDTVILNSVVQYFPSQRYLDDVISKVTSRVINGGKVFIGDIRDYRLLNPFHIAKQLRHVSENATVNDLKKKVALSIAEENELLIDPSYFVDYLLNKFPQIAHVELLPKIGEEQNEMNRFRYDVVLHIGKAPEQNQKVNWIPWQSRLNLQYVKSVLANEQPECFGIKGVQPRRNQQEVWISKRLNIASNKTIEEISAEANKYYQQTGIDPFEWFVLEQTSSYQVHFQLNIEDPNDGYDVFFTRREDAGDSYVWAHKTEEQNNTHKAYTNQPLARQYQGKIIDRIKSHLQNQLPNYMIPNQFVFIDDIPLTGNGKIDRASLPYPFTLVSRGEDQRPRNELEQKLETLFIEILRVEKVSVFASFFELNGDSLLAAQLVSKIRDTFDIQISLREFFESPTIAGIASILSQKQESMEVELIKQLDNLSEGEIDRMLSEYLNKER